MTPAERDPAAIRLGQALAQVESAEAAYDDALDQLWSLRSVGLDEVAVICAVQDRLGYAEALHRAKLNLRLRALDCNALRCGKEPDSRFRLDQPNA